MQQLIPQRGNKFLIANKDHFIALAREAERAGRNRQVDVDVCIDTMDDEGTNLVVFNMLHEHIAGCKVDPHVRTWWMLKLKGTMEPVEVFLDISMENFFSLPTIEFNPEEIK